MSQQKSVKVVGGGPSLIWIGLLIGLVIVCGGVIAGGVFFLYPQLQVSQHYNAGVAFQEAGDMSAAEEQFKKVIEINANYKDTQERLAIVRAYGSGLTATATALALNLEASSTSEMQNTVQAVATLTALASQAPSKTEAVPAIATPTPLPPSMTINPSTVQKLAKVHSLDGVNLAFSRDGIFMALGAGSALVQIISIETGQVQKEINAPAEPILALSPDGSLLVAGNDLWRISDGSRINAGGTRFAFSPDSALLASWQETQAGIKMIKLADMSEIATLEDPGADGTPVTAQFSPDGSRLVVGWNTGHITVFETTTGNISKSQDTKYPIKNIAIASDSSLLALNARCTKNITEEYFTEPWKKGRKTRDFCAQSEMALYNAVAGIELASLLIEGDADGMVPSLSANGKSLALGFSEYTKITKTYSEEFYNWAKGVLDTRTATQVTGFDVFNQVGLWNSASGALIKKTDKGGKYPAFSHDGGVLAFINPDGQVEFWDSVTGSMLHQLSLDNNVQVKRLLFSADGRYLAVFLENGIQVFGVAK